MLKSKMAVSSASSGNSKVWDLELDPKLKQTARAATRRPSHIRTHVSIAAIKFPASGKYDVILDSFVAITPTMHVRGEKALFDVIMHKI